jgi:hypothetical protein
MRADSWTERSSRRMRDASRRAMGGERSESGGCQRSMRDAEPRDASERVSMEREDIEETRAYVKETK